MCEIRCLQELLNVTGGHYKHLYTAILVGFMWLVCGHGAFSVELLRFDRQPLSNHTQPSFASVHLVAPLYHELSLNWR